MAHVRVSRAVRKNIILIAMYNSEQDIHTVSSIARMVGMASSTYLRGIMDELVWENILKTKAVKYDDGSLAVRYYAHKDRVPENKDFYQLAIPF